LSFFPAQAVSAERAAIHQRSKFNLVHGSFVDVFFDGKAQLTPQSLHRRFRTERFSNIASLDGVLR
jgi:hypothetical protein